MHGVTGQAVRLALRSSSYRGSRFIAGRRYPPQTRLFHLSNARFDTPNNPENRTKSSAGQDSNETTASTSVISQEVEPDTVGEELEQDAAGGRPSGAPERLNNYGSAARRSLRNRKQQTRLPPIALPIWFWLDNVKFSHELPWSQQALALVAPDGERVSLIDEVVEDNSSTPPRYALDQRNFLEIIASVRAGLRLPNTAVADGFAASKCHTLLQCPKEGGHAFLEAIVSAVACRTKTDMIRLDAQDIAELAGDYMDEFSDLTNDNVRSLGYDTHHVITPSQDGGEFSNMVEDEDGGEADNEDDSPPQPKVAGIRIGTIPIASLRDQFSKIIGKGAMGNPLSSVVFEGGQQPGRDQAGSGPSNPGWMAKMTHLLETIVSGSTIRKTVEGQDVSRPNAPSGPVEPVRVSSPLIVMVNDYKEIQSTELGGKILEKLHEIIRRRRLAGEQIVIVGTVSSEDLSPNLTPSGIRELQAEHEDGPGRTIFVVPHPSLPVENAFKEDRFERNMAINLRHVRDMLTHLASEPERIASIASNRRLRLASPSLIPCVFALGESVWSYDQIHRLAFTALGVLSGEEDLTVNHLEMTLNLLHNSDDGKFRWAEKQKRKSTEKTPKSGGTSEGIQDRLEQLRKKGNKYEKRLLNGVVKPENIHTTFQDVHAPSETIQALKTLTSLSLVRPDAFSYGVLAKDKITGLLLYGPPGTGKTLLAKAVAKDSGATVLEVSGSDLYDMYVGQGEKNVRAVFSVAKQLSPCVVFIDEADAILGSRSAASNRTSHRELINQFLREWDGMNELSAFVMVATNRPFDLDDAVLRRLPRRLLVDLPAEKDRESILGLHLQDEVLDASVSLSDLAARTPFYSGSDLKNVCVAAALACVREEVDAAAEHTGPEPIKYAERRVLTPRHFDKAMEEISASISEDMGSLTAIRKFDEKYGDRRGRRKRNGGWGFSSLAEMDRKVETPRVRE